MILRLDDLLRKPTTVQWIAWSVVALAAVLLTIAVVFDSFREFDADFADITNDWVAAAALMAGDNPYRDLDDLGRDYAADGYIPPHAAPDSPQPKRTPRTPGALLLALPLLLVPLGDLVRITNMVSAVLMVPTLGLALWPRRSPFLLPLSIAVLVSVPALWSFRFATVSALVALLLIIGVVAMKRDIAFLAGASIALAATLKLFPGILLVVAARRSMRMVMWCISMLALLNIVPLLAFDNIDLSESVDALAGAGARFGFTAGNISITKQVAEAVGATPAFIFFLLAVGVMCTLVYRRPSRVSVDSLLLMSMATLLAPISWAHYLLALFPLAVLVAGEKETSTPTRATILFGSALMIPTLDIWVSAAGALVFAVAAGFERLKSLKAAVGSAPQPLVSPVSVR